MADNFPYDIFRGEWEEPGLTIDEHTSSPPLDWSEITNVTLHYPGSPYEISPDTATVDRLKANLRSSQRYYIKDRGYSYGYNAVVWGDLTAEVRGQDFRCAANGTAASNTPSFAVQIRAGGDDVNEIARPASPAEVESVRRIVAWCEKRAGRKLAILGHQDHKQTNCPGDAIFAQIQGGVFRPEQGDNDMVPINPVRLYDSREHSALVPGKPREIKAVSDQAFVSIACGDAGGPGFISISPIPTPNSTSLVNYQKGSQYIANSAPTKTTSGRFWVTANVSSCQIIVDQFGS